VSIWQTLMRVTPFFQEFPAESKLLLVSQKGITHMSGLSKLVKDATFWGYTSLGIFGATQAHFSDKNSPQRRLNNHCKYCPELRIFSLVYLQLLYLSTQVLVELRYFGSSSFCMIEDLQTQKTEETQRTMS